MNDEGERLSPVQGGYGLLVDWLDSVSGKDWLGDLKVSLVHPYGIVPQAGMTQVADMDFFFLKTPQTKRQIRKFYGVDVNDENESDPSARRLGASADTTDQLVTMATAYYRNGKGGIGRLRDNCGAFSSAVMLCAALEGADGAKPEHRPQTYARVQRVYRAFIARNGSICCAELLGREKKPESPTPDARTNAYYSSRPCAKIIRMTCKIIDEMLAENAAGQED